MTSSLEQLKATGTVVVSDSGDFGSIKKYQPQDATTNPSLILAAAGMDAYQPLIDEAIKYANEKDNKDIDKKVDDALDRLLVEFGREILKIVPGRVSTEVDAQFSYDKQKSIDKALHIIELYESLGVDRKRVLIKIASTWEGIQAARHLQKQGINCNLTLMFSLPQAIAAAEANAFLISPFVGRILDWYKAKEGKTYSAQDDPGVKSVGQIYNYYKKFGHKTIVMGASFRNIGEITELAGCDYLTISPNLLEELYNSQDKVPKKLHAEGASNLDIEEKSYIDDEKLFRQDFEKVQMAVDKLDEGIKKFAADADKLKGILKEKLQKK